MPPGAGRHLTCLTCSERVHSLDITPAGCYPCCLASGSYAEYERLRSKDLADAIGAPLKPAPVRCEVSGFRLFVACLAAGTGGGGCRVAKINPTGRWGGEPG